MVFVSGSFCRIWSMKAIWNRQSANSLGALVLKWLKRQPRNERWSNGESNSQTGPIDPRGLSRNMVRNVSLDFKRGSVRDENVGYSVVRIVEKIKATSSFVLLFKFHISSFPGIFRHFLKSARAIHRHVSNLCTTRKFSHGPNILNYFQDNPICSISLTVTNVQKYPIYISDGKKEGIAKLTSIVKFACVSTWN